MEEQKKNRAPFKLMISGSRSIRNLRIIFDELEKLYTEHPNLILISGGAKGVDSIAEEWGRFRKIQIEQHKPDWATYGKGAGIVRNKEMVLAADYILIFWDGESKGTKSVIDFCEKQGKKYLLKILEN